MEEILPDEIGNAELRHTQWVQSFSTGESSCPACEAAMEREFQEYERKRKEKNSEDDNPPPQNDIPY